MQRSSLRCYEQMVCLMLWCLLLPRVCLGTLGRATHNRETHNREIPKCSTMLRSRRRSGLYYQLPCGRSLQKSTKLHISCKAALVKASDMDAVPVALTLKFGTFFKVSSS